MRFNRILFVQIVRAKKIDMCPPRMIDRLQCPIALTRDSDLLAFSALSVPSAMPCEENV